MLSSRLVRRSLNRYHGPTFNVIPDLAEPRLVSYSITGSGFGEACIAGLISQKGEGLVGRP